MGIIFRQFFFVKLKLLKPCNREFALETYQNTMLVLKLLDLQELYNVSLYDDCNSILRYMSLVIVIGDSVNMF